MATNAKKQTETLNKKRKRESTDWDVAIKLQRKERPRRARKLVSYNEKTMEANTLIDNALRKSKRTKKNVNLKRITNKKTKTDSSTTNDSSIVKIKS
eukprot:TRINITY_DN7812_c0_g1_i1.p1 TRINITY_DN7812_c0_g1~~TRINITY_DN7812_c0_g1_i1.p1  ORF type:complete len:112 (-),score=11.21 TRINITY_DN7812_c0_g1_i1:24-314(-)